MSSGRNYSPRETDFEKPDFFLHRRNVHTLPQRMFTDVTFRSPKTAVMKCLLKHGIHEAAVASLALDTFNKLYSLTSRELTSSQYELPAWRRGQVRHLNTQGINNNGNR